MSWRDRARCTLADRPLFYPDGHKTERERLTVEAKRLCAFCPVIRQCLEHSIASEAYGTWGGKTEVERELIRHERGLAPMLPIRYHQKNNALKGLVWESK